MRYRPHDCRMANIQQAALAEMPRNLARQGFRPAETAISVFSLKQAVHEHSEFGPREDDVACIALRRAR